MGKECVMNIRIAEEKDFDYIKIDTGHGDYLCADVMEKKVEGDNE